MPNITPRESKIKVYPPNSQTTQHSIACFYGCPCFCPLPSTLQSLESIGEAIINPQRKYLRSLGATAIVPACFLQLPPNTWPQTQQRPHFTVGKFVTCPCSPGTDLNAFPHSKVAGFKTFHLASSTKPSHSPLPGNPSNFYTQLLREQKGK